MNATNRYNEDELPMVIKIPAGVKLNDKLVARRHGRGGKKKERVRLLKTGGGVSVLVKCNPGGKSQKETGKQSGTK